MKIGNCEVLKDGEEWRWIKEVGIPEERYMVSNMGRVASVEENHFSLLRPLRNTPTYFSIHVGTSRDSHKRRTKPIHRLVALAFIPNPYNKPCVNHIDGNTINNISTNLEWVTSQENAVDAVKRNGVWVQGSRKAGRPIIRIDPKTGETQEFPSCHSVARLMGGDKHVRVCSVIWQCATGWYKTAYGYQWRWK